MWARLPVVLALSALGVALAAMPAGASESRVGFFAIACDGTNKYTQFNASGLGAKVNRFIQGSEVTVIDTRGALLRVVVTTQADETKQLITMGPRSTTARADLQGFIQVTTNSLGQVPIAIEASCSPGGPLQAIVTVYFF